MKAKAPRLQAAPGPNKQPWTDMKDSRDSGAGEGRAPLTQSIWFPAPRLSRQAAISTKNITATLEPGKAKHLAGSPGEGL